MERNCWGMARRLFETAVELPASEWDVWLLRECDDDALRGEVRAMLEADLRMATVEMLPGRVSEFIAEYAPAYNRAVCPPGLGRVVHPEQVASLLRTFGARKSEEEGLSMLGR